MVDMSVAIGRTMLANPVMPGSGTFGEGLDAVMDLNRLGAIVAKTITPEPREGCPLPRVVEYKDATLMAIGIPNKGPEHFVREIASFYRRFSPPFVASISAPTADAFGRLAGDVSKPGIDVIEANISCPNLERDGRAFATDPEATEQAIRRITESTDLPVWAKLSPNAGDAPAIAQAAEAGGAEALTVANAMVGMAIDAETMRPRLGNITGGMTGPATKPVILFMAYQVSRAVKIPIIGCGGISNAEDAIEYLLAGASAIQAGTINFVHPTAMLGIIDGIEAYCRRKGIATVRELTGALDADEGATLEHLASTA